MPATLAMSATLALTEELISRPSVTPADEGCQELLASRLQPLGFQVERLRYGNVDNLWARRGRGTPVLCFAGHTDVVPTGPLEEWRSDPFRPTVRDGLLYGRGAADMKSGLAAMLTATEAFVAEHPGHSGTLAYLITSDEEGPSVDGTRRVVETLRQRGEHIDWCIVGEPSSEQLLGDTIKIGRRGSLSGRLTVHGVQGHIAYPQFARNPVHNFAPALAELASRVWDQGNEHFQPTTFQVSNLNAGTGAPNVIPGELKARFNLRYSPVQTLDGLKRTVEEILQRHQVNYSLEWYLSGEPFYTPPGRLSGAVGAAVRTVTGRDPNLSTGGGTSDGRFIAPMGVEVVELGVVGASIHKVNECVRVEDIDGLHAIYLQALRNLLA
jgi:succinyl-diaminopimelate desuccinylase